MSEGNKYTKGLVMFRRNAANVISGPIHDDLMSKFKNGEDLGGYEAWIAGVGLVTRDQVRW